MSLISRRLGFAAFLSCVMCAVPTFAQSIVSGYDVGDLSIGKHPFTDAAQALFNGVATSVFHCTVDEVDFEGPLGSGVTITSAGWQSVGVTATPQDVHLGFNHTAGGGNYYQATPFFSSSPAIITFTFAPGVMGFGAFYTGVENAFGNTLDLSFNDGSFHTYDLKSYVGTGSLGGIGFFGFFDPGKNITAVTLTSTNNALTRDIFGIDDLRLVRCVPEPGLIPFALTAGGLLVGLLLRRRNLISRQRNRFSNGGRSEGIQSL